MANGAPQMAHPWANGGEPVAPASTGRVRVVGLDPTVRSAWSVPYRDRHAERDSTGSASGDSRCHRPEIAASGPTGPKLQTHPL